jgi:hypothetical protein
VEDSTIPQTTDYSAYQTSTRQYNRPQSFPNTKSPINFNPKLRLDLKQHYQSGTGNPLRIPKAGFNPMRSVTMPNKRSFQHPVQQTNPQAPPPPKRQYLEKDAFQRYRQERDAARREADRIVREKYFKVNSAVTQDEEEPQNEDPTDSCNEDEDDTNDDLTEDQFYALRAESHENTHQDGSTSAQAHIDLEKIFSS